MEAFSVYKDMQSRTNGEIYIGVVGPVRTGKSTFIKKFMDTTVIPNIEVELNLINPEHKHRSHLCHGPNHHDDRAEVYPRTGRHRKNG